MLTLVACPVACQGNTQQSGAAAAEAGPTRQEQAPDAAQPVAGEGATASDPLVAPSAPDADPSVDWDAWSIVYAPMHSAHDGVHSFQLPAYIEDVATDEAAWLGFMHSFRLTDAQVQGLIVYMRSLPPETDVFVSSPGGRDFWGLPAVCEPNDPSFDLDVCVAQLPAECRQGDPAFDVELCRDILGMPGFL